MHDALDHRGVFEDSHVSQAVDGEKLAPAPGISHPSRAFDLAGAIIF
jgi:hypothetical protein